MIAMIAKQELSEAHRQEIEHILAHHPDPNVRTLEEAAVWPDLVEEEDHPFHHHDKPKWHYSDRPIPREARRECCRVHRHDRWSIAGSCGRGPTALRGRNRAHVFAEDRRADTRVRRVCITAC